MGYKLKVENHISSIKLKMVDKSFDEFLKKEAKSISKVENYQCNYNYMITQLFFIEKILNGADVILVSEEWINKSSGRGDIYLEIVENGKKDEYKWPYWFPFQLYENVFRKLFPWADFSIDHEYYYSYDLNNYHNEYCSYDPGDDEYIPYIPFEEYRKALPSIRGVITSGEVARYKLHLSVNEFGNAFYESHRRLTEMSIYNDIKFRKCLLIE